MEVLQYEGFRSNRTSELRHQQNSGASQVSPDSYFGLNSAENSKQAVSAILWPKASTSRSVHQFSRCKPRPQPGKALFRPVVPH